VSSAPIVVHRLSRTGGRRVTGHRHDRDEILGAAYSDHDLVGPLQEIAERYHRLSRLAQPRLAGLTGPDRLSSSALLTIAVELAARDRAGSSAHGCQRGLEERGLGRCRGGLTSKIHLACDGRGRPLSFRPGR